MQIVQMGLCDINNSLGGVLEPQSVTRAKNHKVSAQAIENAWQTAMTWGSTAVQRGLREVTDWSLVHLQQTIYPSWEEGGCRALFPDFPQHCRQSLMNGRNTEMSFTGLRSIMYAFTQTSRWTHTHTVHHMYPPVFVSRHPFFLNAPLL